MGIFVGKGYRIYFKVRDGKLVILLCGGDKSSQARDIQQAKDILNDLFALSKVSNRRIARDCRPMAYCEYQYVLSRMQIKSDFCYD